MIYIIVSLLIVVAILIYFPIADKCNIIDKPNQRSSHSHITLRGGGIVYWVAALLYTICNYQYEQAWVLFVALTLVSFVSFWDDVKTINAKPRLVVQLMAMSLVFYVLQLYQTLPWWAIIIAYIVFGDRVADSALVGLQEAVVCCDCPRLAERGSWPWWLFLMHRKG